MATQSMVAVGFILLSVSIAALLSRYRVSGHLEWIMASALVALGGIPALWLAADWAGWFTATLFVLLIASPLALLDRARLAAQRRQWKRAARFHWWAYLLHPTPWTRFGLILRRALSDDRPGAYLAALTQIEATGSRNQKALSRLMRAQEERDWEGLLMLSRTGEVGLSEAKPHEIRALGELGRLDEMVQIYQNAAKWLHFHSRKECMLLMFAFTGRVERVQQLVDRPLYATDDASKTYWLAVARLRRDRNDVAARSMLTKASEMAAPGRVRQGVAQQLQRAYQEGKPLPVLAEESERILDSIIPVPSDRWRAGSRQRSTWSHATGLMLLILIIIIAVMQRYSR